MDQIVDIGTAREQAVALISLARTYLTSVAFLWQVLAVALTGLAATLGGLRIRKVLLRVAPQGRQNTVLRQTVLVLAAIVISGLWFLLTWVTLVLALSNHYPSNFVRIAVNLLAAWVAIRICTRIVRNPVVANSILVLAWSFAALNILGLLGPLLENLNAIGFSLGVTKVTGLTVLKGIVALILLLWAAMAMSRFLSERIKTLAQLTPTLQILFSKLVQFLLIALAIVLALQVMGIPLTAFAIFGGAMGIGIGLGLQKAASNVISGLMLLMDKSVRPGDVISVKDTFGWVTSLGGRYVGVRTRDGIEHLIPNEVFVSNGVENWSYLERSVRLKMPFTISYAGDPRQAIALAIAAASGTERVLKSPEPSCLFMGFGDFGAKLELRIWINDPQNGVSNVKSDVYLRLWDKLKDAGFSIPVSQVDPRSRPVLPRQPDHG